MDPKVLDNKIIMVVDDESENFRFIEASLRKTQAQIVWAKNGEQAVEFCKTQPQINLILMDVKMPIMNGFEATLKIRATRPDIPIFVLTAYKNVYDNDKRMRVNFDGLMQKPLQLEELVREVNNYFNR